jgi:DNA polymerase-4
VAPRGVAKSLSAETTFADDIADEAELAALLWRLSVKVSDRLKAAGLAAGGVTLKLKRADFRLLTRSHRLGGASDLAETLFRAARPLLAASLAEAPFRLIGLGADHLGPAAAAATPDLLDPDAAKRDRVERATDAIRARFGDGAIGKGRGLALGGDRSDPATDRNRR